MDTGTHTLFGLGLAGLAMADPIVASDTAISLACLLGTVAGALAPDADILFRFKSNADYIKHHRGLSHSLPAILVWTGLITLGISLLFPGAPLPHLAFWILAAVVIHVFTDLFNSYGVQAIRPFRSAWIRWNIVPHFDPFIFGSHLAAILLWIGGVRDPAVVFPCLYAVLSGYYAWRTYLHRKYSKTVPLSDPNRMPGDQYTLIPTLSPFCWHVIRRSENGKFEVGEYAGGLLKWLDSPSCKSHPAAEASKTVADVKAILTLVPFPCVSVKPHTWGYMVRWEDIRYRYKGQYPFAAVVLMNKSFTPLQSYVGWLSDDRLAKRLRINTY